MTNQSADDEEPSDIAARASRLRTAVSNAQGAASVSHRAKMPLPTLSNYMQGRDMKASALVKLADACGVSVEWLATGTGRTDTPTDGAIFGHDLMLRPVNFWMFAILLRSCQEGYSKSEKPTLKQVFEWIAPPYRIGHDLSDRRFEIVDAEEKKP